MDVIEIDAASHTGVDHVREQIIENIRFAPSALTKKVFIIDEVHMLSKGAFNALLKTLEEPPAYGLFILATTELHKIPETIVSRCQRFDFHAVPAELIVERLETIAKAEGTRVDEAVLQEIARRSGGHVRDAISLLEQVMSLDEKHVTQELAQAVMPIVQLEHGLSLLERFVAHDAQGSIREIDQRLTDGVEPSQLAVELVQIVRSVLIVRLGGEMDAAYTHEQGTRMAAVLEAIPDDRLRAWLDRLLRTQELYQHYPYHIPQLGLELAAIDICGTSSTALPTPVSDVEPVTVAPTPSAPKEQSAAPVKVEVAPTQPAAPEPVTAETSAAATASASKETSAAPQDNGTVTLEQVKKYWSTFQKSVRERHASLPLALELAEPIRVDDGKAIVKVQFEFYAETLNQPKNNTFLADVLTEVIGTRIGIQGMFSNIEEEPEVASVLEAFGGSVVSPST